MTAGHFISIYIVTRHAHPAHHPCLASRYKRPAAIESADPGHLGHGHLGGDEHANPRPVCSHDEEGRSALARAAGV